MNIIKNVKNFTACFEHGYFQNILPDQLQNASASPVNVINPSGLISTASGVEAVGEQSGQDELTPLSPKVCLVNVERVPGRCKAFLPAKVCVGQRIPSSSVLFEPDGKFMQETDLQLEESVLLLDEHGQYWVCVSNPTPDPAKISPEAMVRKLEMVKKSKADTTPLELKSDPDHPWRSKCLRAESVRPMWGSH